MWPQLLRYHYYYYSMCNFELRNINEFFFLQNTICNVIPFECYTQTVNIVDAYKDPRFDPSVDEGTEFVHKTVLCMPIKNSDGCTIGVIQVICSFLELLFCIFLKKKEHFKSNLVLVVVVCCIPFQLVAGQQIQ